MKRAIPLVNNEVYHIVSRSIAQYQIFNNEEDFQRFVRLMRYYRNVSVRSFSQFIALDGVNQIGFDAYLESHTKNLEEQVQIIAFCLMPTHIHLVIKQLYDNAISKFLGDILNSYTRYFNITHHRKGPLWEARFKNVLVESDEQLLHLTRYIHLNPVTAYLVSNPEEWAFSSYREYIKSLLSPTITDHEEILNIAPSSYKKFVNDRISYQRELAKIKALLLD